VLLRALERPGEPGESSSAEAERLLYFTLLSAIDAGLIRTMEDALKVLRHASQPLGPMVPSGWNAKRGRSRKKARMNSVPKQPLRPGEVACLQEEERWASRLGP